MYNDYVFEKDFEELKKVVLADNQIIPTFEDLLKLAKGKIFLNIEVKAPWDKSIKVKYDIKTCVSQVLELIYRYEI